jgi:hypothetical protein
VTSSQLALPGAYERWRVSAAHRATLFAAFLAGQSRAAVREMVKQLRSAS